MLVACRTQAAEEDLQEIAFQIGLLSRRPNVADKIIDELIEQANNLAITSQIASMGTEAPEIGGDVRLFCHKRWVLISRYMPHGFDVLRIVDGSDGGEESGGCGQ
jgi:plasmid stabilization system protein ParE